jgi:spore germination protein YaaH
MVDKTFNSSVLRTPSLQQKIIQQSIEIAKENGFDGILLDYESSALAFDTVIKRISTFSDDFYKSAHAQHLSYDVALYGDTFFRSRPYNVKDIAQHSDRIFIMAYDFHKANGSPGPNFPLNGKSTYGYDFTSLMTDFTEEVRPDKLTVVFGMFGYDWQVNSKGEAEDTGVSISDNNAQKRFLSNCELSQCVVTRDPDSDETKVTYHDEDGNLHEVWFEDQRSVAKKKQYLQSIGVSSTSYWAYSFF